MKNKVKILLLITAIGIVLCSCQAVGQEDHVNEKQTLIIEPSEKEITDTFLIKVDPRIELISIIQYLGDYQVINPYETAYKERIDEYFKDYKNHETVKKLARYHDKGFSYDAPVTLMLMCDDINHLKIKSVITDDEVLDYIIGRIGNRSDLEKYVALCNEFMAVTNFNAFYTQEMDYYDDMIAQYSKHFENQLYTAEMEEYFGTRQNSYTVILGQLQNGSYGPRLTTADGSYDIFSVIGPINEQTDFSDPADILYHEFGHSFVNPLGEKYAEEVDQYKYIFKDCKKEMVKQAYTIWSIVANEYVIRAVDARLQLARYGEDKYETILKQEEEKGFTYIRPMCEKLELYEQNRDKYPVLEDYYLDLLTVFER